MKFCRRFAKIVISLSIAFIMTVSGSLGGLSFSVVAEEAASAGEQSQNEQPTYDDNISLGEQLAELWGFDFNPELGTGIRNDFDGNPLNAPEADSGKVGVFSVTPKELAIIDGYIDSPGSSTLSSSSWFDSRHDYVKFYDGIALSGPAATMADVSGTQDYFKTTTFQTGGALGYPRAAIAADLNGDAKDEIIQVHLDLEGLTPEQAQTQNPTNGKGIAFYSTVGRKGGSGIEYSDYREIVKYNDAPANRFIPSNVLDWASFMPIEKGKLKGDGTEQVVVACGGKGVYVISGGNPLYNTSVVKLPSPGLSDSHSPSQSVVYSLAVGDIDYDGRDEVVATYISNIFENMCATNLVIWEWNGNSFEQKYNEPITVPSYATGDSKESRLTNCNVTIGDIDYDGWNEIVVGGFNKGDREMVLAYAKCSYNDPRPNSDGFVCGTKVWDDGLTATVNSGMGQNIDTRARNDNLINKKASPLENSHRYGHSWNWTIPLQSVSLTGYVGNHNYDQIYFGNGLYYFNQDNQCFEVYDDKAGGNMDDYAHAYNRNDFDGNNASIISMTRGTFITPTTGVPTDGREQLMIYYVKDNKGRDDKAKKDYGYSFELAFMHQPQSAQPMDVQVVKKYLAQNIWGATDFYPLVTAPNLDDDTYLMQYVGKTSTMTDPIITAVLQGVPYFADFVDYFAPKKWDWWSPGTTSYGQSKGVEEGSQGNLEMSAVFGADREGKKVEFNLQGGATASFDWENTSTVTNSITYFNEGMDDCVVMQSTPMDIYIYMMYTPPVDRGDRPTPEVYDGFGEWWEPTQVAMPGYTVTRNHSVESYNHIVDSNNLLVDAYNAANPDMPPVKPLVRLEYGPDGIFPYTPGDPFTYPKSVNDYNMINRNKLPIRTADNPVTASDTGQNMGSETEISFDESHSYSYIVGPAVQVGFAIGTNKTKLAIDVDVSGGGGEIKNNMTGTTYSGSVNNYLVKGYGLTAKLNMFMSNLGGAAPGDGVPVIVYTIENATGLPKLPDNILVDDKKKTPSSVTITYEIPKKISPEIVPDYYELQVFDAFKGVWNKVADSNDGGALPVEVGKNTFTVTKLDSGMDIQLKVIAHKRNSSPNEYVIEGAKTAAVGDKPIITMQPKDALTSAGNSAEFTIEAKLPESQSPGKSLRYEWYYAKDAGEPVENAGDTENPEPKYEWIKFEDTESMPDGVLKGAKVSGATDSATLKLENLPATANKTGIGCVVAYMLDETTPVKANSAKASLYVTPTALQQFNVKYESIGNGVLTAVSGETPVDSGSTITQYYSIEFKAEPGPGCVVTKWMVNGEEQETVGNTLTIGRVEKDIDVKVLFDISQVSVTYGASGEGTVSAVAAGIPLSSGERILPGSAVIFTATPKEEYAFRGWQKKSNETGEYNFILDDNGNRYIDPVYKLNPTENIDVLALFGKTGSANVSFTAKDDLPANGLSKLVVWDMDGKETVLANGETVPFPSDGKLEFTIKPEPGASVEKWTLTPADNKMGDAIVKEKTNTVTVDNLGCDYSIEVSLTTAIIKTVSFTGQYPAGITVAVGGRQIESGAPVRHGSDVTFFAKSEDGSPATSWMINDETFPAVNGEYVASGISTNINATPVFGQEVLGTVRRDYSEYFNNLDKSWAADSIKAIIDGGGFDNWAISNMEPNDLITRATYAVLLKWYSNGKSGGDFAFSFNDINQADWTTDAISWIAKNGYLVGNGNGDFMPNEPITKEQLVTATYRYITSKGIYVQPVPYPAVINDMQNVSPWAYEAVSYFVERGLIFGDSDGYLNPQSYITFAEFSTILENLANRRIESANSYVEGPFAPPMPETELVAPAETVPTEPVVEHEIPVIEPEAPAAAPETPVTELEIPATEPQAPATEPEIPATEPQTPATEPQAPATETPSAAPEATPPV